MSGNEENKEIELLREYRRGWVRVGILGGFFSLFVYVVVVYTGLDEGMIKPDVLYSFLTGVLVTKLIDHYITANNNDRGL